MFPYSIITAHFNNTRTLKLKIQLMVEFYAVNQWILVDIFTTTDSKGQIRWFWLMDLIQFVCNVFQGLLVVIAVDWWLCKK